MRMRELCLSFMLLLALVILSACGEKEPSVNELRIVTENTGMREEIQRQIESFKDQYPEITVILDVLPNDEEDTSEREAKLEQLRAEIMAGEGPDIYLLPTKTTYWSLGPLFEDVEQSMHNGIFADISEDYDADDELDKASLNTTVMDAGLADGGRYVLPLRYSLPVVLADNAQMDAHGITHKLMQAGWGALAERALSIGDKDLAIGCYMLDARYAHNLMGRPIDYEKQELLISAEDAAAYFKTVQDLTALREEDPGYIWDSFYVYVNTESKFWPKDVPLCILPMERSVKSVVMGRLMGYDLALYPLRAADGSLVADVTYFGAVDASCPAPQLGYAFLRQFLSQESQWEESRNITGRERTDEHLMDAGWPVRDKGSAPVMWRILARQINTKDNEQGINKPLRNKLAKAELTDEEFPIPDQEITAVEFTTDLEWQLYTVYLADLYEPRSSDELHALAEDYIQSLERHLAEG